MTFPRLTATEHEIKQTRRICELRGWRYYSSTDARTDDAHVFDGVGREETLVAGRFMLEHIVMMLEAEGVHFESDYGWVAGKVGNPREYIMRCGDPHDLTAAMDALIALEEMKKKQGTEKP